MIAGSRIAVLQKTKSDHPGIGGHVVAALQQMSIAERFDPRSQPEGDWDFYLFVDDGDYDPYHCPEWGHPSVFWALDMVAPQQKWRGSLEKYIRRLRTFDYIFISTRSGLEFAKERGLVAKYLSYAASESYHKPYPDEVIEYDWIALWHNCGKRIAYAKAAQKAFPKGRVAYVSWAEYSRIMCQATCALNLGRSPGELNQRVYETMATGVPLITNRVDNEQFIENEHYRGFDNIPEMLEQIAWANDNVAEAQEMAARARALVLEKHTYRHRMEAVFG